jgi:ABC-type Zn uptake system ZnuABC Zn-binding protein ZnuA
VPPSHYAKGNYFTLPGRSPFSRLIYPVPEAAGLGVHLTIDLGGQAKFGPDVQWVDSPDDLVVDPARGGAKGKSGSGEDHSGAADHDHDHGPVDAHWWNSPENMQRASRVVAGIFAREDPPNAAKYEANAAAYSKKLGDLKKWARREISRIPADRRKLATSHLALSYFAKEFGFRLIPVQGLNPEIAAQSRDLAAAVDTIRKNKIGAVFPEQGVNPKLLTEISRETGVKFGGELIADGNGTGELATFTGAFEHNVTEIVKALAPSSPAPSAP